MSHLQKVAGFHQRQQFLFLLRRQIPHKQSPDFPVFPGKYQRTAVGIFPPLLGLRVQHRHADLSLPDLIAPFQEGTGGAGLACQRAQPEAVLIFLHPFRKKQPADPQSASIRQGEQFLNPVDVIRVRMGDKHRVQSGDPLTFQIRPDHIRSHLGTVAAPSVHQRPDAVSPGQDGIPLSHVDHGNLHPPPGTEPHGQQHEKYRSGPPKCASSPPVRRPAGLSPFLLRLILKLILKLYLNFFLSLLPFPVHRFRQKNSSQQIIQQNPPPLGLPRRPHSRRHLFRHLPGKFIKLQKGPGRNSRHTSRSHMKRTHSHRRDPRYQNRRNQRNHQQVPEDSRQRHLREGRQHHRQRCQPQNHPGSQRLTYPPHKALPLLFLENGCHRAHPQHCGEGKLKAAVVHHIGIVQQQKYGGQRQGRQKIIGAAGNPGSHQHRKHENGPQGGRAASDPDSI